MGKLGFFLKRMLPVVLAVVLILIHLMVYRTENLREAEENSRELLSEATRRKADFLSEKMNGYRTLVSSLAFAYSQELSSEGKMLEALEEIEQNTSFDYIRFLNTEGISHTSSGAEADCSDRSYYIRGMKGETGICDVQNSRLNGESMMGFFAPVYNDGEISGVFIGFISQKNLASFLEGTIFSFNVEVSVISPEGIVVGTSNPEVLNMDIVELSKNDSFPSSGQIPLGEVYDVSTSYRNGSHVAFVSRLEGGGYYVLMAFPLDFVKEIALRSGSSGNNLFIALMAIFFIYVAYTLIYFAFSTRNNMRERRLIVDGILDNDDLVLLIDKMDGVEVIKPSSSFSSLNASLGVVVPISSLISFFSREYGGEERDFMMLFYSHLDKVRKNRNSSQQFVEEFFDGQRKTYIQFIFRRGEKKRKPFIIITIRQVTDLVEKERAEQEKLETALAKAEEATKAKGTFLANMSHDLRTPMNAIIGYTNLALANIKDYEKEENYLGKIEQSSKQLLALLNDILDMTAIEGGKVNLDESAVCIKDVFASIESITETSVAAKGQMLHISVEDLVHENVLVDKVRLSQILLNCVTNAIKYTPEGGDIWLSVHEKGGGDDGRIEFIFSIKDNGIGMSPSFLEKIWEPFERERNTTVSRIQGTGLGMSITRNLAFLMGGDITVTSKEGEGSEFIVTLPLPVVDVTVGSIQYWTGKKALVAGNTKTVTNLPSLLMRMGVDSEVAENFSEAKEKAPGKDLVFMDMTIPRKEGMEAIRTLKDMAGEKALMVVTAYRLQEGERNLESYGVDVYAPKPVFFSEIQEALTNREIGRGHIFTTRKEMDLRGKRVLLVEDNELNREIAQIVLEDIGMKVECAVNGMDGVEKVENSPSPFDIVLMDIQMPEMDGYEAARRIRNLKDKVKASVPILSMTANAFPEDRRKAFEAGMDGHVPKPLENNTLVSEIIEAILSRG